ncbi:hypothetical protein N7G274_010577 [Stereocaulon virgatum]|uniref:Uncharacterized protein n=1 Tax=Stereocaulon virgatum TaxID=373712 RepID=A0ABR3ZVH7_9LECA
MKFTTASILALLTAFAHSAPAPAPDYQPPACNPNPHGRYCSATLYGAAGVEQTISYEINFQVDYLDVPFSVSKIQNLDDPSTGNYEYWTFYGIDGSVTNVGPGQTVDVGPPQVQTRAYCQIQCPAY